jgi:L-seryl-tRNA(Ser) seleniumtransferase
VARKLQTAGLSVEVKQGASMVGGGTLPEQSLPTVLLGIKPPLSADAFARALRLSQPPLMARVDNDLILIDMRTVFPEQDGLLATIIASAWAQKD